MAAKINYGKKIASLSPYVYSHRRHSSAAGEPTNRLLDRSKAGKHRPHGLHQPRLSRPRLRDTPVYFVTPSAHRPSLSPVNHTVAPLSTPSQQPLPVRHYLRTRALLNESRRLNDLYKIFVYTNTMLKETKRRYWGGIFAIVDTV